MMLSPKAQEIMDLFNALNEEEKEICREYMALVEEHMSKHNGKMSESDGEKIQKALTARWEKRKG